MPMSALTRALCMLVTVSSLLLPSIAGATVREAVDPSAYVGPSSALSDQAYANSAIVSDAVFEASTCMEVGDVQVFLEKRGGVLDTLVVPDHLGVRRSVAEIICDAAQAYGISPRVLLAKLQCEQSLLEDPTPRPEQLDWAMGCGVPDNGSKNYTLRGLGMQIWAAAAKLDSYRPEWHPGISKWCYDGTVWPSNRSTWALYRYTPWISSNRLFSTVYTRYFGDPRASRAPASVYSATRFEVASTHGTTGSRNVLRLAVRNLSVGAVPVDYMRVVLRKTSGGITKGSGYYEVKRWRKDGIAPGGVWEQDLARAVPEDGTYVCSAQVRVRGRWFPVAVRPVTLKVAYAADGDADGNGDADLVLTREGPAVLAAEESTMPTTSSLAADVDGDGLTDIVRSVFTAGHLELSAASVGDPAVTRALGSVTVPDDARVALCSGDVDADGDDDIILTERTMSANEYLMRVRLLVVQAGAARDAGTLAAWRSPAFDYSLHAQVFCADVTGDGAADLVRVADTARGALVSAYRIGSDLKPLWSRTVPGDALDLSACVGDLDANVAEDIAVVRPDGAGVVVDALLSRGSAAPAPVTWARVRCGPGMLALGGLDVNRDGRSDLLISDGTDGSQVRVIRSAGTSGSEVSAAGVCITADGVLPLTRAVGTAGLFGAASGGSGRVAGADRFETAVRVSRETYPTGAQSVVIVGGHDFADAASASVFAVRLGAPVLLSRKGGALPAATVAEIVRLHPSAVYVVGGTSVIPASVERQLTGLVPGVRVRRIAGADRYATAAGVADVTRALFPEETSTPVFVSNGHAFADALSIAPLAASKGGVVLLTEWRALPPVTGAAIARMGGVVTVVGGDAMVSANAYRAAGATSRLSGRDRWATNVRIARSMEASGSPVVASGADFPDALCSGVLAARTGGPLLLVDPTSVPRETAVWLGEHDGPAPVVIGGMRAVTRACDAHLALVR